MGAPADPLILSQRSRIVRFAVKHRIPAMYGFREFVSDGGLLSYGPNLMEMFRRSATYADRIPERRQAQRHPHRAADEVRAVRQPEGREGARPDDPAVAAAADGSGDRVAAEASGNGSRMNEGASGADR